MVSGNSILIVDDGIEVVYFDISADISFVDIMVYAGLQSSATQKFNITIPESDNGSCESEQNARAGDTVTLNISPRYGYKLADVQILNESDGSIVNFDLESMSFVMPYSGVRIEVSYEIEAFTVRFMNDGKVISERVYSRGETVDVPDMPKEIIDGEYCYTFKGWSPTVSTVSGDTVYYAEYARTRIGDGAVMHRIDYKDRSYLLYLEIGIAAALFFGGVFLLVRLVLKKVRKHKTKNK